MADIFCTTDCRGYVIHLEDDRWEHVTRGHRIMSKNLEAIQKTVEKPEAIHESTKIPNRYVYLKQVTGTTYSKEYVTKVVVEMDTIIPHGYVVTAYPDSDYTEAGRRVF